LTPLKPDDSGVRITKDAADGELGNEPWKPVGSQKTFVFRHAKGYNIFACQNTIFSLSTLTLLHFPKNDLPTQLGDDPKNF